MCCNLSSSQDSLNGSQFFLTKQLIFTYLFSVVTDGHISQKAKCYSLSITQVDYVLSKYKQERKCFVLCIQWSPRRADLGVGRGGRAHPFFFEIKYYFYRILRKTKSIYIAGKWASVPATPV